MKEKFLPIGSIVLLKGATKRLMITGYCSAVPDNPEKSYDYVACLFPEGNLAGDQVALFDHEQIGTIVHMGLDDEEFKKLDGELKKAVLETGATASTTAAAPAEFDPLANIPASPDMPPFSLDNINSLLNTIKAQGIPEPIKEPTVFNEENIKKPVFAAPKLGETNKKQTEDKKEEEETISDEFSVEDYEQEKVEEPVIDGTPVLQLQLIGEDLPTTSSTSVLPALDSSSDSDSGSDPVIPGLTRL